MILSITTIIISYSNSNRS